MRRAEEAEKLLTLDEKERTLTGKMLVIADGEGPVALAGVMGGEHSGIFGDTRTVVFESANFEWSQIRLTAKALGMRTESSARFEKGLPPYLAEEALDRAMALIELLGAGEIARGVIDCRRALPEKRRFEVSVPRVNKLLGQSIPGGEMAAILGKLGFEADQVKRHGPSSGADDCIGVVVPLWRQDVETYADIAEEVQRIFGYGTIPSVPPPGEALLGRRTRRHLDMIKMKNLLAGMGLDEAISYSFMAPDALDKLGLDTDDMLRDALSIVNPIGEDYSLMRTTLVPAMLRSIATNLNRKAGIVRLFEMSRAFRPKGVVEPGKPDGGYSLEEPCFETEMLCIGVADEAMDFFDVKGIAETLLARFGIERAEFAPGAARYYHPGRSATISLNGEKIGMIGEAHPDTALAFEIERKVLLAELNVDRILSNARLDYAIRPLPKFPAVSRDLAVTVDRLVPVGDMLSAIRRAGGELLESAELFDIYEGRQAGEGKKSVAFALVFRAAGHTLVDEEANGCFEAVVQALNKDFAAEIRK